MIPSLFTDRDIYKGVFKVFIEGTFQKYYRDTRFLHSASNKKQSFSFLGKLFIPYVKELNAKRSGEIKTQGSRQKL